ncbi:hypothetical protein CB1_000978021 [Camelus ferus]|nr:hypothetical protein CB1_000978021 [Camelus ferus]
MAFPLPEKPARGRLRLCMRTTVTVFCVCVFVCLWSKQLAPHEAQEQQELRAGLRWRRLQDEVQNSPKEMQVLRPNKEKTGHVSDSGSSVIKHGLNPEKVFMQVHYLKINVNALSPAIDASIILEGKPSLSN